MSNQFGSGIEVSGGVPNYPGYRFLENKGSGMFLLSAQTLGLSASGQIVFTCDYEKMQIYKDIIIPNNAKNRAVLTSDSNGNARWQINSTYGIYQWNTIYQSIDINSANNELLIIFGQDFNRVPAITLTKECDTPVHDIEFFIKDKTTYGFTLYSGIPMTKHISSEEITYYASCRLNDGGIGICYYNVQNDRMEYIYSDKDYNFSSPIIIDTSSAIGICDIAIVNGNPAIAYIVDDGSADKWRYIRATDTNGSTWGGSVTIATSTADITFLSNSSFLRIVDNKPAIFFNNETGRAKIIIANDINGATWGAQVNISNLTNHQIIDVKVIDGRPAVLARSNTTKYIYYVISSNFGSSWPIGATQLYKFGGSVMAANVGDCCNTLTTINGTLCIITSENDSNNLYIIKANDQYGTTWGQYTLLANSNTTSAYPQVIKNGNDYYLIYNEYVGIPSKKNIVKFTENNTIESTDVFISNLQYCTDHQIVPANNISNNDGCNNVVIIGSQNNLSMVRFYGNDFKVNWIAQS
jgi:hypothetical protein